MSHPLLLVFSVPIRAGGEAWAQCRRGQDTDPHQRKRSEVMCISHKHTHASTRTQTPTLLCVFQQWATPPLMSSCVSCRRSGHVRCVWTSGFPLSSSLVVTWWCVATVLPACVTAPSAEPPSEAASEHSCPESHIQVQDPCVSRSVYVCIFV